MCRRMSEAPVPTCTAASKASFTWAAEPVFTKEEYRIARVLDEEVPGGDESSE